MSLRNFIKALELHSRANICCEHHISSGNLSHDSAFDRRTLLFKQRSYLNQYVAYWSTCLTKSRKRSKSYFGLFRTRYLPIEIWNVDANLDCEQPLVFFKYSRARVKNGECRDQSGEQRGHEERHFRFSTRRLQSLKNNDCSQFNAKRDTIPDRKVFGPTDKTVHLHDWNPCVPLCPDVPVLFGALVPLCAPGLPDLAWSNHPTPSS